MLGKLTAAVAGMALAGVLLGAAENLDQLKARLARETDPAKRAKITVKIGPILLGQFTRAYSEQRYETGTAGLEEYLGYIRRAYRDLENSGRKARKKPKGFKELEIHLRQATLRLDDLAQALPYDQRAPLEAAKQELEAIWEKLVRALFDLPPRPADGPSPGADKEKRP